MILFLVSKESEDVHEGIEEMRSWSVIHPVVKGEKVFEGKK